MVVAATDADLDTFAKKHRMFYVLLRLLPSRFHCRDNLVAQGKESKVSAAVVFLPQDTLHYGKCGSDKCYCVEVSSTRRCSYIAHT